MIVIAGATGTIGGEVVRALVRAGSPVRALTRAAGTRSPLPDDVEITTGDLNDPQSLTGALRGASGLFLLSGYRDTPGILEEARRAGVERVVLLSSGAVVGGDRRNAMVRYNAESEDALRASGLAWTILRPSGFMSNALRWLPQLRTGDLVRAPFADVAVAAIDPYDIGAVAVCALTGSGHEGRSYRLSGPEPLLPAQQVDILGAALGRDLRFAGQPDEEARTEMLASMPPEYVDAFFAFFADGDYDDSRVYPTVADVTGRAPRTFADWAAAHADAFSERPEPSTT